MTVQRAVVTPWRTGTVYDYAVSIEKNDSVVLSAEPLDEGGVAARYKVTPRTVRRWRSTRTGPDWFYASEGRNVRYRLVDLIAWEKDRVLKAAS